MSGRPYQPGLEVQLRTGAGAASQDRAGVSVLLPGVRRGGLSCPKVCGRPGAGAGMSEQCACVEVQKA